MRAVGARASLLRQVQRAELVGVGVDIVSTGPDRNETIILRDPFSV
jgi:adenylosuccinate synthase